MKKSKLISAVDNVKTYKWPSPQKRAVITALALGEPGNSGHLSELLGIPLRTLHVLWSSLRAEGWVHWDGDQYAVSGDVTEIVDLWIKLSDAS
ncbi:MAG: hypothetical protein AAGA68_06420 [Pseudomonadota bacterium]